MKNLVENIEKKVSKLIQLYQSVQKEKEEILTENNKLESIPIIDGMKIIKEKIFGKTRITFTKKMIIKRDNF